MNPLFVAVEISDQLTPAPRLTTATIYTQSRIFPGNISEPSTLQKMIEQLRSPFDSTIEAQDNGGADRNQSLDLRPAPTIIMDAGIASEENILWLRQHNYKYIVVIRKRHMGFDEDRSATVKERDNDTVRAMRVEREDEEIELYCHSQGKEAKEDAMQQRVSSRLEAELKYLAEDLQTPRRLKKAKKVTEKIGRLRQIKLSGFALLRHQH